MDKLLQDKTVLLRALEAEDIDTLYKWENDTSLWAQSSSIAPFSRKQLWEYINTYDGNIFTAGQLRLMIISRENNSPVGMIDLYEFDPINRHAYVGIMVSEEFQGKGYASSALRVLEQYCRLRLGMHQLASEIDCENTNSQQLFQNAGYKICGRLRSWRRQGESYKDIFILQKMLQNNAPAT